MTGFSGGPRFLAADHSVYDLARSGLSLADAIAGSVEFVRRQVGVGPGAVPAEGSS